ncbi:hypothetical protein [Paenibacillus pedocola]|uniref:hypothetical protein n=1 Tax=Paenibacillus pedocola TaxID=3242193 RepID=UPI00287807C5|nr:hypothetical protein [Paenibacillus typhae]
MPRIPLLWLLSVLILCALTACSFSNHKDEPASSSITVTAGGSNIPAMIQIITEGHTANTSGEAPFRAILEDSKVSIPYVKLGESVQIQLEKGAPAVYELSDVLLSENGGYKYRMPEDKPIVMEFSSGSGSFVLKENMAAFLSSNTKDYEPGATIRGFKLTKQGGGEKQEYYFVLRTDAGSVSQRL